ncbi:MAG: epimerase [Flavobacteriales bacterium]|nr:epimerase [Flavobacteriales bacterium]
MKILLSGANGYIGKRLIPVLIDEGHEIIALVRDRATLHLSDEEKEKVKVYEADFLNPNSLEGLPIEIDVAFYLMHALSNNAGEISTMERQIAENFVDYIDHTEAKQIIYLGGISNDDHLSKHLSSRLLTEELLSESKVPLTVLRAAIIIGSGGASFEIIRDLVEKLPVMVTPKWLNTKCQPIGIRNVINYLSASVGNEALYGKTFDIGGPEVLTYKEMLLQFAEVRGMKRYIGTLPVMTPRLSSYWLYFVTSTSYRIAVNLVDSMKNEVIVKKKGIREIIPQDLMSYKDSVKLAFKRIEQNMVVSSWTDTQLNHPSQRSLNHYIQVPQNGTFKDQKSIEFPADEEQRVIDNIWSIGGERGWYYGNWLWKIRGYIDKLFGGVGLRRGRRSPDQIYNGDSLDFWRVLLADQQGKRLLLFAEMKLPGDAWLEFKIESLENGNSKLSQTATFRPKGLNGRLYWWSVMPFHLFVFKNMIRSIANYGRKEPLSSQVLNAGN